MSEWVFYLTIDTKKHKSGGYIAVISQGHPQRKDKDATIKAVTVVKNAKAAKKWFAQQVRDKPWETRQ